MSYLQSFTTYLRQLYFSSEIAHYGKGLISVFFKFFLLVLTKILILVGTLGTRLLFYEV